MSVDAAATLSTCGRGVGATAPGIPELRGLAAGISVLRRLAPGILAWSVAASAFADGADARAWFIAVAPSIVKVEAHNTGGSYSLGTGVAVAPGRVVTNCHVTREAQRITLVKGALRTPATGQLADLEHDLCLLDAPALAARPVPLRSATTLRVGQRVRAVGFTGGVELALREGVVGALHRLDDSRVIQSTTAFTSGASGGGLFDDEGHLVGILTFRLPGSRASYFSAPVDWIATRSAGSEGYVAVAPVAGGVAFWQQPASRLPYFMRAARLAAEGDWHALVRLADEWSASERENPEPWLSRGQALLRLDRPAGAARAFEQAVALQPDAGDALHGLGVAYFRLGRSDEVQRVFAQLDAVDPDLADDLAAVGGFFRKRRGL